MGKIVKFKNSIFAEITGFEPRMAYEAKTLPHSYGGTKGNPAKIFGQLLYQFDNALFCL